MEIFWVHVCMNVSNDRKELQMRLLICYLMSPPLTTLDYPTLILWTYNHCSLLPCLPWALLTAMQSKLRDPFLKVTPADPGIQHPSLAFCTAITWYLCVMICLSQSPFIPEPRVGRSICTWWKGREKRGFSMEGMKICSLDVPNPTCITVNHK